MTLNDGGKQRIEEERMDSGGEENCILLALCDNAISVPEFSSVSVVSRFVRNWPLFSPLAPLEIFVPCASHH